MDDRVAEWQRLMRADIIVAAEKKLGRPLSDDERAGIERLESLMLLESVERSFSHPSTDSAIVESDLKYFSKQNP